MDLTHRMRLRLSQSARTALQTGPAVVSRALVGHWGHSTFQVLRNAIWGGGSVQDISALQICTSFV